MAGAFDGLGGHALVVGVEPGALAGIDLAVGAHQAAEGFDVAVVDVAFAVGGDDDELGGGGGKSVETSHDLGLRHGLGSPRTNATGDGGSRIIRAAAGGSRRLGGQEFGRIGGLVGIDKGYGPLGGVDQDRGGLGHLNGGQGR